MNTAVSALIERLGTSRPAWPAVIVLMLAFASVAAAAENPTQPSLGFVDGSAVTLSPDRSGKFKLDLAIKNSGNAEGVPSLKLVRGLDKKCDAPATVEPEPAAPEKLSPGAVAIAQVTISGVAPPATCYVGLAAREQGTTALKQIKLTQHYVTPTMLYSLFVCVGISVVVALATWLAAGYKLGGVSASYKLGSPAWDFTKSWTSTTTLAGAAIATALTLSALPELTRYASKSGYAALALLISFAVVVAPFVFVAFRTGEIGKDPKTGQDMVVYAGCLWLFLASGALTLFAGTAQVVVLFLLLDEIFLEYDFWSLSADRHPWLALNVGSVSTGALLVALCWYVGQSMFLTIKLQKEAEKAASVAGLAGTQRPRLAWPVL